MVKIQIIFLYTTSARLNEEQKESVKNIVIEEYCSKFGVSKMDIVAVIADAHSNTPDDIILAINSPVRVMNEAVLNSSVKKAVASRLSLLSFMRQTGFSGNVGIHNGEIKGNRNEPSVTDKDKSENQEPKTTADDYKKRAAMYVAEEPKYTFEMLKIPKVTLDQIEQALGRIEYEREVFEEWGLYAIMPSPVSAMSFYGPPGTGKSLAAEAIANKLNKKIIRASYADIENKYVGEGPKNVSAIFLAAEQQDAVLLIDEADSLLSKRLVNVSDPSGQAMNSMRSQLLISLEKFHGIVIFATNLVVNYDKAFMSRLINIKFEIPDAEMRKEIWQAHLLPRQSGKHRLNVPLSTDVNLDAIAEKFEICGRDIRNSVVNACVEARRNGLTQVNHQCLCDAAAAIVKSNKDAMSAEDHTDAHNKGKEIEISDDQKKIIADTINKKIAEKQSSEYSGE